VTVPAAPGPTGADALLGSLLACGVDVCFTNPGTSEMHVVAALDRAPGMRGVLTLFEGVATGAADGYARMADRPAATLLHLGPGLGNGLANLHNARRAGSPVVNVVGDHALDHARFDAPLQSDIAAVAGSVSGWLRHCAAPGEVGADAAAAVAAARRGCVATLVLPADVTWGPGGVTAGPQPDAGDPDPLDEDALAAVAAALRSGGPAVLLVGGDATRVAGLAAADRVAAATGARLLGETFPARIERGAGRPALDRLAYLPAAARHQLGAARHLVLAGARSPAAFFGYPGRDGDLVPPGAAVHHLAGPRGAAAALAALADLLAPGTSARPVPAARPGLPTGELTVTSAAAVVGALLPEGAVVVDEAITSGVGLPDATAGAPPHDWLPLTGGAIGFGLPAATGAAIARPDRPVWCLQADGSAMYTVSALWTQAREGLDVTTVVYHNSAYAILRAEMAQVGAAGGAASADLFDLARPRLDFVALATGMGVPAERATTADELAAALRRAAAEPGPHLVEAVVPALA
jgi:acetolactate synthase-1/2/3 large subunit